MVKIPEGTGFDEFWEVDKPIRHFMLKAKPWDKDDPNQSAIPPGGFVFSIEEIQGAGKARHLADAILYAQSVADQDQHGLLTIPVTPFDIKVNKQCWLVLQLDKTVNWQFSPDQLGCVAKHSDEGDPQGRKGFNVALRHVLDDKTVSVAAPGENCHLILFGVVHRSATDDQSGRLGHHYFNLNIEFFQVLSGENGGRTVLPLAIDPDVPNTGPGEFP